MSKDVTQDGLFQLLEKAKTDRELRKRILDTKRAGDPMLALCELSTELGCDVTVGEIYAQGEGYLSHLSKSCIGATDPRPGWGDIYDQFFASIEGLE